MTLLSLVRRVFLPLGAKLLPRGVAFRVLRGPLSGVRFVLGAAAGGCGGARVFVGLVEPETTRAFVAAVTEGEVVLDIGANVGYYSLLASRLVGPEGHVYAFEPVVRNLAYLYRHLSLNKANNVTVIPAACSDRCGVALFELAPSCAEGHLGAGVSLPSGTSSTQGIVPVVSVDRVAALAGVSPDAVKIDVEGAELHVLHGARETIIESRPVILLSVHSPALHAACTEYLAALGYFVEVLLDAGCGGGELLATPLPLA